MRCQFLIQNSTVFLSQLPQILTDFRNSFTGAFSNKATMKDLISPSYIEMSDVILMFECFVNFVNFGKIFQDPF